MKKLLLFSIAVLVSSVICFSQVTDDPALVKDGTPVVVPRPSETRPSRNQLQRIEIPGTIRRTSEEEEYPARENPGIYYENTQRDYTSQPRIGDTTRVFYLDQEGRPVGDPNKKRIEPVQNAEVPARSQSIDTLQSLPSGNPIPALSDSSAVVPGAETD